MSNDPPRFRPLDVVGSGDYVPPRMFPAPVKGKPGRPRFRLSAARRALIEEWRPGMSNRKVHERGIALGIWPAVEDPPPDADMVRKRVARIRMAAAKVYDPPE